jgi:hypothetical protein
MSPSIEKVVDEPDYTHHVVVDFTNAQGAHIVEDMDEAEARLLCDVLNRYFQEPENNRVTAILHEKPDGTHSVEWVNERIYVFGGKPCPVHCGQPVCPHVGRWVELPRG